MRIVFSGPHGTGKSTLVDALSKLDRFKEYHTSTNLTRRLAAEGFKINQEGTNETQSLIMAAHSENIKHKNLLADRCAIDCLCYTIYLLENDKLGENPLNFVVKMFNEAKRICKEYDFVFYVPPEFPVVGDGIRPDDKQFRLDIENIFKDITFSTQNPLHPNILSISGTIEERIQQVMEKVNEQNG